MKPTGSNTKRGSKNKQTRSRKNSANSASSKLAPKFHDDGSLVHTSVLLQEVIEWLKVEPDYVCVDATINGGGHSEAIARQLGSKGILIGLDADSSALVRAKKRLTQATSKGGPKLHLVESNFRHLQSVLASLHITEVNAVLFDLGLSSNQLDDSGRGFSLRKNEPLTMTFTAHPGSDTVTARDVVNTWEEENLADIIYGFGEEKFSRRIARAIVEKRNEQPIETTEELAEIIEQAIPKKFHGRLHPATKTFQAIRMAVNEELDVLSEGLTAAYEHLAPGGRIAVISFHSLEDRAVKRFFKERADEDNAIILTKKPIAPTEAEIEQNPRSRSAKLRVIEKRT